MAKKVIIIGAGIAGLSTGSYLQANGFQTQIIEMHTLAGGLCSAWKRGAYTIEGCIHWLVGSSPKSYLYKTWLEVVDLTKLQFVDHEVYSSYHAANGTEIVFYTKIDKLEAELLKKAPEDRTAILELTSTLRAFSGIKLPSLKNNNVANLIENLAFLLRTAPKLGLVNKYMKLSEAEYAKRFMNPVLREAFSNLFVGEMAVFFSLFTLAWMHNREAGYPIGGSLKLISAFQEAYENRGGQLLFGQKVEKIVVENGQAKGVVTKSGQHYEADYVISAADGYDTLYTMLGGKYLTPELTHRYENLKMFPSYIQVSLGVKKTFANLSAAHQVIETKAPIQIDDQTVCKAFGLSVHTYDPTLAPSGSTLIRTFIGTYNHAYWTELRKNNYQAYVSAKKRIAEAITEEIERITGPLASSIEMTDVSTPATVIRYTNNWKGSMEGWLLTPEVGLKPMKQTLKGLQNFYMVGQWVQPGGGLPAGLMTGRKAAMEVCKKEGITFKVSRFL